jgi:phosphotransferase system  glucose/maltose/N-acetylglucosamine-specific IIC component
MRFTGVAFRAAVPVGLHRFLPPLLVQWAAHGTGNDLSESLRQAAAESGCEGAVTASLKTAKECGVSCRHLAQ